MTYTIEEFIKDCMKLKEEELISIAVDDNHIITATKLTYIKGYDDEIQFELCTGHMEDGCNVCEDLIDNTWATQSSEADMLGAIEYLKGCI